mmetsp:Transcript_14267/g.13778  ORF Transcript_14267/g.13778 Transcript_14267/m.13778 type:complete len:80 (+) Transcript_14267:369-608(+)
MKDWAVNRLSGVVYSTKNVLLVNHLQIHLIRMEIAATVVREVSPQTNRKKSFVRSKKKSQTFKGFMLDKGVITSFDFQF